jgi:hypothetical protein
MMPHVEVDVVVFGLGQRRIPTVRIHLGVVVIADHDSVFRRKGPDPLGQVRIFRQLNGDLIGSQGLRRIEEYSYSASGISCVMVASRKAYIFTPASW